MCVCVYVCECVRMCLSVYVCVCVCLCVFLCADKIPGFCGGKFQHTLADFFKSENLLWLWFILTYPRRIANIDRLESLYLL